MTVLRMMHRAAVEEAPGDDRAVTVVCNTPDIGRDDLILISSGIDLTNYRRNPIFLAQHNPDWPVARAEQIDVDGNDRLVARAVFPPAGVSPRADEVLGLIRAGVINCVSTGFDVTAAEPIDSKDPKGGIRVTRCELQEVSFVSIPALPSAEITGRAMEEVRRMARMQTKRATEDWRCGASRDLPIDDSGEWDGQAAEDSIFSYAGGDDFDPAKAKLGFLLYDATNDKERGSYKLPFARAVGGELKAVTEGLRAAASRLPQTDANAAELAIAKGVLEAYEKKAGVGDEERAALLGLRRAIAKRGLYEVGELAWLFGQLGWIKDATEYEASIENNASAVPAMVGEALKQLGAALVAMTQEEVAELIGGVDVDAVDPDEIEIVTQAASPAVARFRIGMRRAARVQRTATPPPEPKSLAFHRLRAARFERDLLLTA